MGTKQVKVGGGAKKFNKGINIFSKKGFLRGGDQNFFFLNKSSRTPLTTFNKVKAFKINETSLKSVDLWRKKNCSALQ